MRTSGSTTSASIPSRDNIINKLYKKSDYRRSTKIDENTSVEFESYRSDFRRDYARLIHSSSFRRLQGKTQLFPGAESDFFRNRLTHSMEVAQIAKSIANRINHMNNYDKNYIIDVDVVEFAALAHDLGHPPFGHTGETALSECMAGYGGFEGNAQTLRILSRLEKKAVHGEFYRKHSGVFEGKDERRGLNLTYRSLASIIKYDNVIPMVSETSISLSQRPNKIKGYYESEHKLVDEIKNKVLGRNNESILKVLECQIMDIADDIAYASSDLEDSFKAGFLSPIDMLRVNDELGHRIASEIKIVNHRSGEQTFSNLSITDVRKRLEHIFAEFIFDEDNWFGLPDVKKHRKTPVERVFKSGKSIYEDKDPKIIEYASFAYNMSKDLSRNSYFRTRLTSWLIGNFIRGINFVLDKNTPCLSEIVVNEEVKLNIEVLKHYTYHSQVMSPKLKIIEHRGKDIVKRLFEVLSNPKGSRLLPVDFRNLYDKFYDDEFGQKRLVCDFISGMTDRYALEYYARITSDTSPTLFKPL